MKTSTKIKIKKIHDKLVNPTIDSKPESNFLNEIQGKEFKSNVVDKAYLKSFRTEREAIRKSDRAMAWQLGIFLVIVALIVIMALNK